MALAVVAAAPAEDITPEVPNSYAASMATRWSIADALMGGSEAMREMGEALLPQHVNEDSVTFQARLTRSFLLPAFAHAVGNLADIVFSDAMNWNDNLPADLTLLLNRIDREGRSIDGFAKQLLSLAIAKGEAYVIADEPPLAPVEEGRVVTLADRARQKVRPYLALISADNMLAYDDHPGSDDTKPEGGDRVCTYARWIEVFNRSVPGTFGEEHVQRVIEWRPGEWTRHEKVDDEKWVTTSGVLNVKRDGEFIVPIVRLRLGNVDSQRLLLPPLHGLAEKNVEHWQSASDQRAILTVSRFPMLGGSGVNPDALEAGETGIKVGPNATFFSTDPQSKFYYIETAGTAIAGGTADLERLEKDMAMLAYQPLMFQQSGVTATKDALGQNKANSSLASWALDTGRALDLAVALLSVWQNKDPPETLFKPNVEFGIETLDAVRVTALQAMRTSGDLSRGEFIKEMKAERVLSEEFDVEANEAALASEGPPTPKLPDLNAPKIVNEPPEE